MHKSEPLIHAKTSHLKDIIKSMINSFSLLTKISPLFEELLTCAQISVTIHHS